LLHIRVTVLSPPEMNVRRNLEYQDWDIRRDATTIKLVRMELLLELNRREPSVLAGVVNVTSTCQRVERKQIRSRFIFLNKLRVINATSSLLQGRF
jgi:hypothetical protein